jgi:hypothetical protein
MTPLFVVSPKMNAERLAAACRAAIGSAPG